MSELALLPTLIVWTERAVRKARNNLTPRSRQDGEQSGDLLYKPVFCQKNDAPPSPLVPASAVPLQPLTGDDAATLAEKDPGDGISLIQPDPGEGWVTGLISLSVRSSTSRAMGSGSPQPEVPVPQRDEPRSRGETNPTLHLLLADLRCAQITNGDSVLPNQNNNKKQQTSSIHTGDIPIIRSKQKSLCSPCAKHLCCC